MKNQQERRKRTHRIGGERRADDVSHIANALKRSGRIALRVHGTSMLPWVRPGDVGVIRQISIENVRCGDVVLFRRENRLLVHRIVEKRGSQDAAQLFSKGDAHPTSDGVVQREELLGRVVRIYRNGKRIDLDAPGQLALGLCISQLSLHSRFWYPAARFAVMVTRPARRMIHALRFSSPVVH